MLDICAVETDTDSGGYGISRCLCAGAPDDEELNTVIKLSDTFRVSCSDSLW